MKLEGLSRLFNHELSKADHALLLKLKRVETSWKFLHTKLMTISGLSNQSTCKISDANGDYSGKTI